MPSESFQPILETELKTKQNLIDAVTAAEGSLLAAKAELEAFDALAENNRYDTVEDAEGAIEDILRGRASDDCEGSYNCGLDSYTQEFMVGYVVYVGKLDVEYNRHDKTYYYVDSAKFSYSVRDV